MNQVATITKTNRIRIAAHMEETRHDVVYSSVVVISEFTAIMTVENPYVHMFIAIALFLREIVYAVIKATKL